MVRQPKWDKYEAALLIEIYWDIKNGKITRKEAVASLSKLLRDRVPENECWQGRFLSFCKVAKSGLIKRFIEYLRFVS